MDPFCAAPSSSPRRCLILRRGRTLSAQVMLKSHNGCLGSGSRVTAGDAGLERLPGCPVGGPGVTGGTPAGPGFDFAARDVPEVYREDFGVRRDALAAAFHASWVAGYQRREFLGLRFLQLKHRRRFGSWK